MLEHGYNLVDHGQIFMKKYSETQHRVIYTIATFVQYPSCAHDLRSTSLYHTVSAAVVFHRSNTPFRVGRNVRSISFHSKNTKTNSDRSIQVANSNQKCSHWPWAAPSGGQIFSLREIDKSLNWCSSRIKAMAKSMSWRTISSTHLTVE